MNLALATTTLDDNNIHQEKCHYINEIDDAAAREMNKNVQ